MEKKIYIKAISHISAQNPSEEWMTSPIEYSTPYTRAIDPDFKQFISPMQARRMGKLLKRALFTSLSVINETGIEHPEAIITGTGMGCLESTELFLDSLCKEGEQTLKPTYFMQSTHNTISSLIGIQTGCHNYNATYSQGGISFESALLDAFIQFKLGKIKNALVGVHDEVTPSAYEILKRGGFLCANLNSEASVAFMLDTDNIGSICELCSVQIFNRPSIENLKKHADIMLKESGIELPGALMCGYNGNKENDDEYDKITKLFSSVPVFPYKNIFGESYAASGLGAYAAACYLNSHNLDSILLINHYKAESYSLLLLKK